MLFCGRGATTFRGLPVTEESIVFKCTDLFANFLSPFHISNARFYFWCLFS
jgi:hypothetical protein